MTAKEREVIRRIRETSKQVVPPYGEVWLYGSRARGTAHEGSDWDILILLDKPKLEASDYDVAYPFRESGDIYKEAMERVDIPAFPQECGTRQVRTAMSLTADAAR